jgi:hypothetical protein
VSNGWIDAPPPQRQRMGCFAKGCLILTVLFVVLLLAIIGGTIYGVRYLRGSYFPATSIQLPPNTSTEREQQLAGEKWYSFEKAARANTPAHIEMTADELNALIASEPNLRNKAYVTVNGNVGHLRVSIPLEDVTWLKGHYINGECVVQSSVSGNPAGARITSVVINGHPVSDDALNLQYPPWSLRRYLSNWTEQKNLKTFEIRDGKVILETKGSGD